jgi:proteasome lid subunit RPN8/RPN11
MGITEQTRIEIQPSTTPTMRFERKPLLYTMTDNTSERALSSETRHSQETDYPVYLEGALINRIREHARRNSDRETAGFLVGRVFQDERSPEIYAVIDDEIEAMHTEATLISVTISSKSWMVFWDEMKRRKGNAQLLGWWHSHPFVVKAQSVNKEETARGKSECATDGKTDQDEKTGEMSREHAKSSTGNHYSNLFLSSSDIFVHNSFFSWPYQVAVVVDPGAETGADVGVWGWRDGVVSSRIAFVTTRRLENESY